MKRPIRVRILVTGKVQGVYFRKSTQERANALGLSGFVKNLPDGRVLIEAEGDPFQIEALEHWAQGGPEMAEVENISSEAMPAQGAQGFAILH